MVRSARDLAWPDLIWSHFSRSRFGGFDERVQAAAKAGFDAIGLYAFEYRRLRDEEGRSPADILIYPGLLRLRPTLVLLFALVSLITKCSSPYIFGIKSFRL